MYLAFFWRGSPECSGLRTKASGESRFCTRCTRHLSEHGPALLFTLRTPTSNWVVCCKRAPGKRNWKQHSVFGESIRTARKGARVSVDRRPENKQYMVYKFKPQMHKADVFPDKLNCSNDFALVVAVEPIAASDSELDGVFMRGNFPLELQVKSTTDRVYPDLTAARKRVANLLQSCAAFLVGHIHILAGFQQKRRDLA